MTRGPVKRKTRVVPSDPSELSGYVERLLDCQDDEQRQQYAAAVAEEVHGLTHNWTDQAHGSRLVMAAQRFAAWGEPGDEVRCALIDLLAAKASGDFARPRQSGSKGGTTSAEVKVANRMAFAPLQRAIVGALEKLGADAKPAAIARHFLAIRSPYSGSTQSNISTALKKVKGIKKVKSPQKLRSPKKPNAPQTSN